ncbi:MAG: hypothetical protein EB027_02515, partial [Actinobacteria bacterium]|nr:hypothetical protein [Actinomycetota bacterium]
KSVIDRMVTGRFRVEFAVASRTEADETAGARDDDDVIDSQPPAVNDIAQLLGGTVISEYEKNA